MCKKLCKYFLPNIHNKIPKYFLSNIFYMKNSMNFMPKYSKKICKKFLLNFFQINLAGNNHFFSSERQISSGKDNSSGNVVQCGRYSNFFIFFPMNMKVQFVIIRCSKKIGRGLKHLWETKASDNFNL